MKLSRTALVIPLAGLLLVGGAGAVFAATSTPAAPSATATPAASTKPLVGPGLTDVLGGLVTKGTITSAQETAIIDAVSAHRVERRAEIQQIRGFLADGQITQDELNQLPADSPFRALTSLMTDGKVTADQLRSFGRGIMRSLAGGGAGQGMGGRGGMMGGGFGPGPVATPAP